MSTSLKIGDRVRCYVRGEPSYSWQISDIYYKQVDGDLIPVLYVLDFIGMGKDRIYKEVDTVFPLKPVDLIREKIVNIFDTYKRKESVFYTPESQFWVDLLDELVAIIDEYKIYKESSEQ